MWSVEWYGGQRVMNWEGRVGMVDYVSRTGRRRPNKHKDILLVATQRMFMSAQISYSYLYAADQWARSVIFKLCSAEPRRFTGHLQAHLLYDELRKHNFHHLIPFVFLSAFVRNRCWLHFQRKSSITKFPAWFKVPRSSVFTARYEQNP